MKIPERLDQDILEPALKDKVFSGFQLYAEFSGKSFTRYGGVTSYFPGATPVSGQTFLMWVPLLRFW